MKRELDHLGQFLHMAVDYKKKIGFRGQFYIEPKPKEPTKHQYLTDTTANSVVLYRRTAPHTGARLDAVQGPPGQER